MWIKVRTELHNCPTVVRIVNRLRNAPCVTGLSRSLVTNVVIGGLVRVWSLADTHTADGTLDGYTVELLDELVGLDGFCAALEAEEWMIIEPQAIVIPEFEKHNGSSAKARDQAAKRQQALRDRNARGVTKVTGGGLPDQSQIREEKSRSEEKREPSASAPVPSLQTDSDQNAGGSGTDADTDWGKRRTKMMLALAPVRPDSAFITELVNEGVPDDTAREYVRKALQTPNVNKPAAYVRRCMQNDGLIAKRRRA